jgi:SAM-dependent methyltransferase
LLIRKLLEHWITRDLLGLKSYSPESLYVHIAACNSPWARVLREKRGLAAFAVDLSEVGKLYKDLSYYRVADATSTSFENSSVSGASLQCAYEMFTGDNDTQLIKELNRIWKPGGKAIVTPLYMHTHYCAYSTP